MRTPSSPWVFLDLSYLAHRALHSTGVLETSGVATGVLFGFFVALRSICRDPRVASSRVVAFADSKKSLRRDAFPAYKAKRRKRKLEPEELRALRAAWAQIDLLRDEVLPAIGVRVHRQTGLESDDLIASAAAQVHYEGKRKRDEGEVTPCPLAVIVSADGDLWQCVTQDVHFLDPSRNRYFDPKAFKAERGISCAKWGRVKELAGCHSDEVPGIPGVGEGRAIEFLEGRLPSHYAAFKSITSASGEEIRERNRELVVLPHHATKPVKLREPRWDAGAFFKFCARYKLRSFLRERAQWESFFAGEIDARDRVMKRLRDRRG